MRRSAQDDREYIVLIREQFEESDAFVTEICWHYYMNEMTQAEIARLLNITRLRVNQAIQRAKSQGFVKIHVESPFLPRIELQEKLKTSLGLKRAIVSPSNEANYDYHKSVGAALAELLLGVWRLDLFGRVLGFDAGFGNSETVTAISLRS